MACRSLEPLGLSSLPFFLADFFDGVKMDEGAFFVADDNVERPIAVPIAGGDLSADTGVVVYLVRDLLDGLAFARELKPVKDGGSIGLGIALGAVSPEAFAGDDVEQHHWFTIGHPVVILIWDEIKIRQGHHPRAAEAHLNTAHILELVVKYDSLVVPAFLSG